MVDCGRARFIIGEELHSIPLFESKRNIKDMISRRYIENRPIWMAFNRVILSCGASQQNSFTMRWFRYVVSYRVSFDRNRIIESWRRAKTFFKIVVKLHERKLKGPSKTLTILILLGQKMIFFLTLLYYKTDYKTFDAILPVDLIINRVIICNQRHNTSTVSF